jgi:small subunit ribosomal protein S17
MSGEAKLKHTLVGEVVSNKMDCTIAVRVARRTEHPIYRKFLRRSTKLLAHDADNECLEGDVVAIEECAPISKRKSWRLRKIIQRAEQA